ncbi:hypothetical protein KIN20_031079 [Parelaphostrongylus tenuis]|uniref:Uncharacterized protein n=1 Tax=Parelaphostrongylus tenuis TaxID=148309 RepID=A0AAD5WGZ0_PARTN|nr:hypothetical protein KIN20_031079 [Parelaphostrongylus tenuis]
MPASALAAFDVPESQGRSSLLPNVIILAILEGRIIVNSTVTGICNVKGAEKMMCTTPGSMVMITTINGTFLTISGTLSTTNIIMANWWRMMWQNVVGESVSNAGIGSLWISLLFGTGHCRRKLNLNCDGV